MRKLLRENLRFFLLALAGGLFLRLIFLVFFPSVLEDSFIYGDIAKNWLEHGIYGLSKAAGISPTYIRLPGYPMFLALMFWIFGIDHYRAVLIAQLLVDLGTCFICADLALRLVGPRRAKAAFLLAALCPFLANYSAAALTETLEIFFTALALDFALKGLASGERRAWLSCGIACAAAILLRPDGVLLLFALVVYICWKALSAHSGSTWWPHRSELLQAAILVTVISLLPLVPWTVRNWRVFHTFQPLAPRYANEEGEFVPMGFNRWVKTWIADYASVEEVYWQVPGSPIDPERLPHRAFDTASQRRDTISIIETYNKALHISPALDGRFEALAAQRIRTHPQRYYLGLPLARILDMWLRPRTEILPPDTRWWEFSDDPKWSALAVALGVINLFYVLCAVRGWLSLRGVHWVGLLTLFVVLRSAFLGSMENPEPRYTLEMFPIVVVFAAAALIRNDSVDANTFP